MTILHKSGRVLPLLSTLVRDELQIATSAGKFSIFRGNNMASAIEKAYVSLLPRTNTTHTTHRTKDDNHANVNRISGKRVPVEHCGRHSAHDLE